MRVQGGAEQATTILNPVAVALALGLARLRGKALGCEMATTACMTLRLVSPIVG
jgi:hypothetical protein